MAFVFPGQGSQYIGMGMDFCSIYPEFKLVLELFQKRTNIDLYQIMHNGPEIMLTETKYTQPAILAHSIFALHTFLKKTNVQPNYVAGHSLGEFSALVANHVLDFSDALYLVHKRGEYMMQAHDGTPFAMAAILGLESDQVINLCLEVSQHHLVVPANFNDPWQTVISGTKAGVDMATEIAKARKAKRVLPLSVGGPFHSPLVQKAVNWLKNDIAKINFLPPTIPIICNVNALSELNPEQIKENLLAQVTSPVLWVDSIRCLANEGVEVFIEFGPKRVLSGIIPKIVDQVHIFNIDKINDVDQVITQLGCL